MTVFPVHAKFYVKSYFFTEPFAFFTVQRFYGRMQVYSIEVSGKSKKKLKKKNIPVSLIHCQSFAETEFCMSKKIALLFKTKKKLLT